MTAYTAPETSLEAWLRQLSVSLFFRTSGQSESLALADEWDDRVRAAVTDRSPFLAAKGTPEVGRLASFAAPNSLRVTSAELPPHPNFSTALSKRKNLLGGSSYWNTQNGKALDIHFDLSPIPSDPGQEPTGQELLLRCALWELDESEREAVYAIADDLCLSHDLTYGQVGQGDFRTMFTQNHEVSLGYHQGWQMRQLRGYDWITWIPPRLARRISASHRAYAATNLYDVREWDTGLLRLRATDRPETFDEAALRHLFHSVAEILPDGPPTPWEEFSLAFPGPPPMLVYEDARDHR